MNRTRTLLIVLLLTASVVIAATPMGAKSDGSSRDAPSDLTSMVEIEVGIEDRDIAATIRWTVFYPADSPQQAVQANNGNLSTNWFNASERLQRIVSEHPSSQLSDGSVATSSTTSGPPGSEETQYGWILVQYQAGWTDIGSSQSQVTIGPSFAASLSDGDFLTVVVPESLEIRQASTEAERVNEVQQRYRWKIGGETEPRIVLDGNSTEDGLFPEVGLTATAGVLIVILSILWLYYHNN